MKKQQIFFALVTSIASLTAGARETVFDTDGYERTTVFSSGPVHSAQIVSSSARELEVYLYPRTLSDSCYAAQMWGDATQIPDVRVELLGSSSNIRTVKAQIPEALLTANKRIVARCLDGENQMYDVHVLVPGVPDINWQASVEPRGEFIESSHSYSYHSSYHISSLLTVNNQHNGGNCYTVGNQGVELGLFHGRPGMGPFHSDVFVTNKEVDNSVLVLTVFHHFGRCLHNQEYTEHLPLTWLFLLGAYITSTQWL